MIYYLYDFKAYQMKRDGAGKERISELSDYSWITWLYVSEKYYYIYSGSLEEVKAGLYCINRETGIIEGMLPCAHGYFTFLDGSVYYMENYDTVYRVPADNFKARSEEVLTLKSGETCLGLASEGDYVYGLYTADSAELFFQHNIKTQKNNFYKLNQEGVMNRFNVVDSDIYFMTRDTIYRFRAEPEASAFQIETFYSHPFGEEWYMESFEILKDNNIAVLYVTVRAGNEKFVLINLDGKAEPVIIDGT